LKNRFKQRKALRLALLPVVMGIAFLGTAFSQSLADLARQERARRAQETKSVKVYTNADIVPAPTPPSPATTPCPCPAAAPGTGNPPASAASGKEEPKPPNKEEAKPAEKSQADLEKEYRDKFAKLRDQLKYETEKLDVMQRELNLMLTQYYSDPNVALREETFRGQIDQRTGEIEQQKATVEKAKQAIADLEEELRKNGLPPGWAR